MRRLLAVLSITGAFLFASTDADSSTHPSHIFVLFSYGRSVTPDRTHTFGFFAKLNPQLPSEIEEHTPISWLPVITKPRQDPDGVPVLTANGTIQIAPVAAGRVNRERLGWNFSMRETLIYRRKMPGINQIKTHGAFAVTPQQYEVAKQFRHTMLSNVERVISGLPRDPEQFYYRAINQSLFVCPNGKISGQLNCFQAVLASFGACETSGPLSGVSVTDYLVAKLKERKLLGEQYLATQEEIEPLLIQVLDREASGDFDRP